MTFVKSALTIHNILTDNTHWNLCN